MSIYFGLEIEDSAAFSGFFLMGRPSSGKTLMLQAMMSSVLPSILTTQGHRAVIFDVKQENVSFLIGLIRSVMKKGGRNEEEIRRVIDTRLVLTNPFDQRSSAWSLKDDILGEDTAYQIAGIFIPEEPQAQQRYFTDSARDLLTGVIMALIELGGDWQLADVVFACTNQRALKLLLSQTDDGRELINTYLNRRANNDVASTLRSRMYPYRALSALWKLNYSKGRKFSLQQFANSNQILVLANNQHAGAALRSLNQAMFTRLSELILDKPENRTATQESRTWFFLDEVIKLGKLAGLDDLTTNGRSKGAAIVMGLQDLDGLIAIYGKETAYLLMSMCGTFGIFNVSGVTTPKWASEICGEQEVVDVANSHTRTSGGEHSTATNAQSEQFRVKPLFMPSQFRKLPLPSKQLGYLPGFFCSVHLDSTPYYAEIPWSELMSRIYPSADAKLNVIHWTNERDKDLRPWDSDDLARLNLRPVEDPGIPEETDSDSGNEFKDAEEEENDGDEPREFIDPNGK